MSRFTKFSYLDVYYRSPYYIKCFECGVIMSDDTPRKLADRALREGWRYSYKDDLFICPDCYHKYYCPVVGDGD